MANPVKVQNFLDFFGSWDPSLTLVMGRTILVTMPGFFLVSYVCRDNQTKVSNK